MDRSLAQSELAEAEALDRYITDLLAGRHTSLPAEVDAAELRAYLIAAELVAELQIAGVPSPATTDGAIAAARLRC